MPDRICPVHVPPELRDWYAENPYVPAGCWFAGEVTHLYRTTTPQALGGTQKRSPAANRAPQGERR